LPGCFIADQGQVGARDVMGPPEGRPQKFATHQEVGEQVPPAAVPGPGQQFQGLSGWDSQKIEREELIN